MTWKTHIMGGAQIGLIAAGVLGGGAEESLVIVTSAVFGSVLPDIDQPGSRIARSDSLIGLTSHLLSRFTKHRGFTHTIIGAFLMGVILFAPALLRSGRDNLIAYFAALIMFVLIHAGGGAFSCLAGWISAAVYIFGPHIASILTDSGISLEPDERAARLFAMGIILGCISHMIYDSFNKGGVPWLWPVSKRNISLMSIKTDSLGELYFAAVQIFVLAAILMILYRDAAVMDVINSIKDVFATAG